MPIRVADNLPAKRILESENVFVMGEGRALHQDIRPLHIGILNLMPTKIETETQLLRLLGNSPIQVDITLLQTATYTPRHTDHSHLEQFYRTFEQVRGLYFDGLIITGAPVERLEFEEVDYWDELCAIMEWSKTHVFSTLHICWGAQAGLFYHHGVPKHPLPKKLSGVYRHRPLDLGHPLMRGFDEVFNMPHSRYTEVWASDLAACPDLQILATSEEAGPAIIVRADGRQVFVTGHCEYERYTLAREYERDLERGLHPDIPYNYFPGDDPTQRPMFRWRSLAYLLFANWLNYFVYQSTPYDWVPEQHRREA